MDVFNWLMFLCIAIPVSLIVLFALSANQHNRLKKLEQSVKLLEAAGAMTKGSVTDQSYSVMPMPLARSVRDAESEPSATTASKSVIFVAESLPESVPEKMPVPEHLTRSAQLADQPPQVSTTRTDPVSEKLQSLFDKLKGWFTKGNVPVKVGMLVLLAGVAALLRYAGEQGWLNIPPALRYAGIGVAALGALLFGWQQRVHRPAFALAMQGGSIGVLLLVVFAAFKFQQLLQAAQAFGFSVALVAGLCVLAVLQNSRTLVVLGILAGFLAPIWLSTGQGNHVALFSYYALLNTAVFAIAWWRSWRILDLLGFAFTFGIGTLWGVLKYQPEHFNSTEPFLLLFFACYLMIPVLHMRRGDGSNKIDGSLLFGTPLVAFLLQAGLLQGRGLPLALCALAMATIYVFLGKWMLRSERSRLLGQGQILLAIAFVTLAVPLALSAHGTASVFALEGAGLLWLGLRQQRLLPQISGVLLQIGALLSYVIAVTYDIAPFRVIANATFMGGLVLVAAAWASAISLHKHNYRATVVSSRLGAAAYLYGLFIWITLLCHEIDYFAWFASKFTWMALALLTTGWLAAEAHRRLPTPVLRWTTASVLLMALLLLWTEFTMDGDSFAVSGVWASPLLIVLVVRSLYCLRDTVDDATACVQAGWLMSLALLLWAGVKWGAMQLGLAEGWRMLAWSLPILLLTAGALWRWQWLVWPSRGDFNDRRVWVLNVLFSVLGLCWLCQLFMSGFPDPLPWVPLINPHELSQWSAVLLLLYWLRSPLQLAPAVLRQRRSLLLGAALLLLLSVMVLRTVHHWGGVDWDTYMWYESLTQSSLSVTWSILGVLAWVIGSRRGQRGLWLLGAGLMALVLLKLILIDRHHLGNLLGIGSFIAYGLLCTVVGYFAPAPPKSLAREDVHA